MGDKVSDLSLSDLVTGKKSGTSSSATTTDPRLARIQALRQRKAASKATSATQTNTPFTQALDAETLQGETLRRVQAKVKANPLEKGRTGKTNAERMSGIERNVNDTKGPDYDISKGESFSLGALRALVHAGRNLKDVVSQTPQMSMALGTNPATSRYAQQADDVSLDNFEQENFEPSESAHPGYAMAGYMAGSAPLMYAGGSALPIGNAMGKGVGLTGRLGRMGAGAVEDAAMTGMTGHGDVQDRISQMGMGVAGGAVARPLISGVGTLAKKYGPQVIDAYRALMPDQIQPPRIPIGNQGIGDDAGRLGGALDDYGNQAEFSGDQLGNEQAWRSPENTPDDLWAQERSWEEPSGRSQTPEELQPGQAPQQPQAPQDPVNARLQQRSDIFNRAMEHGKGIYEADEQSMMNAIEPHLKDAPEEAKADIIEKMRPMFDKMTKAKTPEEANEIAATAFRNLDKLKKAAQVQAQKAAEKAKAPAKAGGGTIPKIPAEPEAPNIQALEQERVQAQTERQPAIDAAPAVDHTQLKEEAMQRAMERVKSLTSRRKGTVTTSSFGVGQFSPEDMHDYVDIAKDLIVAGYHKAHELKAQMIELIGPHIESLFDDIVGQADNEMMIGERALDNGLPDESSQELQRYARDQFLERYADPGAPSSLRHAAVGEAGIGGADDIPSNSQGWAGASEPSVGDDARVYDSGLRFSNPGADVGVKRTTSAELNIARFKQPAVQSMLSMMEKSGMRPAITGRLRQLLAEMDAGMKPSSRELDKIVKAIRGGVADSKMKKLTPEEIHMFADGLEALAKKPQKGGGGGGGTKLDSTKAGFARTAGMEPTGMPSSNRGSRIESGGMGGGYDPDLGLPKLNSPEEDSWLKSLYNSNKFNPGDEHKLVRFHEAYDDGVSKGGGIAIKLGEKRVGGRDWVAVTGPNQSNIKWVPSDHVEPFAKSIPEELKGGVPVSDDPTPELTKAIERLRLADPPSPKVESRMEGPRTAPHPHLPNRPTKPTSTGAGGGSDIWKGVDPQARKWMETHGVTPQEIIDSLPPADREAYYAEKSARKAANSDPTIKEGIRQKLAEYGPKLDALHKQIMEGTSSDVHPRIASRRDDAIANEFFRLSKIMEDLRARLED